MSRWDEDLGQWEDEEARQRGLDDIATLRRSETRGVIDSLVASLPSAPAPRESSRERRPRLPDGSWLTPADAVAKRLVGPDLSLWREYCDLMRNGP